MQTIWEALDRWAHEAVAATGGLETFLQTRAPKWHQVGRVCFHLAENKHDDTRPFAFMATYTAGFGAAGRLQHLPLRKALEQYAGAQNRPASSSFPCAAGGRALRMGADAGGLWRHLSAHGVVGGTGL